MRFAPKFLSCLVVLLPSFITIPQQARGQTKGQPQMVWLSYAEGHVKFSPGDNGEAKLGKDWFAANGGQVIESGYTLVTESGRAEVEFEDGSTVYLADHSALVFNWLWTHGKNVYTELNLLTGKATIAHETALDHTSLNRLFVQTPTFRLRMQSRQTTTVESTVDGGLFEAVEGTQMIEQTSAFGVLRQGEAIAYVKGQQPIQLPLRQKAPEEQEWDQWVASRLATRRARIDEGLRDSGLKELIPGLAGMVEEGQFYDCQTDRKCWQPHTAEEPPVANLPPQPTSWSQAAPEALAANAVGLGEKQSVAGSRQGDILVNQTMMTRCPIEAWQVVAGNAAATGQYGTCMAGTWNTSQWDPNDPCWRRDRSTNRVRYRPGCNVYPTWTVGGRRYHECHFLRGKGHGFGFVPRQASEQKGHPPVNSKSGMMVLSIDNGHLRAELQDAPTKLRERDSVPKGMERALLHTAPRVAQPIIEAKVASAVLPKGTLPIGTQHQAATKTVTAIRFDYKSGNFVGRTGEGAASHSVVVAHAGGGGGVSGGGSHGSSGGSGSSGGGGGHSGGGSSGGASAGSAGGGHH
jgi:hypothetical protein